MYQIQLWPYAYVWLLNKPYENEVTLRGQNIPLKCCKHAKLLMCIGRGLRSFHTLNVGSVLVKELQIYRPSNFENDSNPGKLESGPSDLTRDGAEWQTFFENSNFDS